MQAPAPSACPAPRSSTSQTPSMPAHCQPQTLDSVQSLGLQPSCGEISAFLTFDETLTPTGGITCSALGDRVIRHLPRPRLTSARSSRRLSTLGSTLASVQISQGNSRDLPAYACRIYVTRSVQVSGFDDCGRLTPLCRLIRFLFVRPAFCLGLPSDSQSPATPLPLANTSPCRVCRGLSPPSRSAHHHSELNSASHGTTRHAWRTTEKAQPDRLRFFCLGILPNKTKSP